MGLCSVKWLVLWTLWAARLVRQPTVVLQLSNGPVRGMIFPDGSHAHYSAIPYATVPERFQSPGPEPKWDDVYEAINENVRCVQRIGDEWVVGTPNCLTLNVYTQLNLSSDSKLPVMVFFHGGGFFQGSGTKVIYGPNYLVPHGVILVTVNYRLNIQGFLCLGIKEAPGNAALKDQVAALRWIQRNIAKFGGDKDNVLIFGESAGAASVSNHLYSPMSKGLFHKAITQSGSALANWAFQYRPIYIASLLAKVMLLESQDPYELYNHFTTKSDGELIVTRVPRKKGDMIPSELLYAPCAEKIIDGEEPFMTEDPFEILNKGTYNKVPLMIGSNIEEGLFIMAMDNETMITQLKVENSLPKNLEILSDKDREEIVKELKRLYLIDEETTLSTAKIFSQYMGEVTLNYPSLEETELLLKTNDNPIYNFLFQYSGNRNLPKLFLPKYLADVKGATHGDDLFYLFSQSFVGNLFENDMIETMSTFWTNFAKYGDPTPDFTNPPVKWDRTNSTVPTLLVIDEELYTAPLWYNERVKYLREVYAKFRRKLR